MAMNFCSELGFSRVVLEGDAKVINAIQSAKET